MNTQENIASLSWKELRHLLADPDPVEIVKLILELASSDDARVEEAVLLLIKEPYGMTDRALHLHRTFHELDSLVEPSHSLVKGAFGFFLFVYFAEAKDCKEATSYLRKPEVLQFLIKQYSLPVEKYSFLGDMADNPFKLHKVGTTSLILHVPNMNASMPDNGYALKIVKPRFWDSFTIANGTKGYRDKFNDISQDEYRPKVYDSDIYFILMEFIEGDTLREYFDKLKTTQDKLPRLKYVCDVANQLSWILNKYKKHLSHLDLSPDNVLVRSFFAKLGDKEESKSLVLIDFGYNYVVVEGITQMASVVTAQRYIAPELFKSPKVDDPVLCDVYSCAAIITEALSDTSLESSLANEPLVQVQREHHGIGGVLRDALDSNPLYRRSKVCEETGLEPLDAFWERLELEIEGYLAVESFQPIDSDDKNKNSWLDRTIDVTIEIVKYFFSPFSTEQWKEHRRNLKFRRGKGSSRETTNTKYLIAWATITYLLNIISIGLFAYVVSSNWPLRSLDYITALLVALTSSIVATKYYLNLFSMVSTRGYSASTEFWLRANSFCFFPGVAITLVVNPSWWVFCIPASGIAIIANNWMTYRFCRKATGRIKVVFKNTHPTQGQDDFLKEFSGWWLTYVIYTAFMIASGILFTFYLDEGLWLLGIGVIVVNIKMYFQNCINAAPRIRYGIEDCVRQLISAERYDAQENTAQIIASESTAAQAHIY